MEIHDDCLLFDTLYLNDTCWLIGLKVGTPTLLGSLAIRASILLWYDFLPNVGQIVSRDVKQAMQMLL